METEEYTRVPEIDLWKSALERYKDLEGVCLYLFKCLQSGGGDIKGVTVKHCEFCTDSANYVSSKRRELGSGEGIIQCDECAWGKKFGECASCMYQQYTTQGIPKPSEDNRWGEIVAAVFNINVLLSNMAKDICLTIQEKESEIKNENSN